MFQGREKKIYAEIEFIHQAKMAIKRARKKNNVTAVSLVTMSTKIPCSECREMLMEFLTGERKESIVKFTLRISDL